MKLSVDKRGITCSYCQGKKECRGFSSGHYCIVSSCPLTRFLSGKLINKETTKDTGLED